MLALMLAAAAGAAAGGEFRQRGNDPKNDAFASGGRFRAEWRCLKKGWRVQRMSTEEATRVMFHVHQKGVGVCGVFSYEVAETKVAQVIEFARQNQHPLQCTLEKA